MNMIQTELTEALADLGAKCPGASLHVSVHDAPFETFSADDVKNVRVVSHEGRTWLAATAELMGEGFDYRIEFYSVDLPQASSPDADTLSVVA
jgi:hypothetical protein